MSPRGPSSLARSRSQSPLRGTLGREAARGSLAPHARRGLARQRTLAAHPGVQAERAAGSAQPARPSPWPGVRGRRGSSCALPRGSWLPGTVGRSPRCRRAGWLPGSCWRKVQSPNEYLTRPINQGARVGAGVWPGSARGPGRVRAPSPAAEQPRHLHSKEWPFCKAGDEAAALPAASRRRVLSPHSRRQRQVPAVAPVSGRCPQELPPTLQS